MVKQECDLCGEGKCSCEKEIRVYFCPNCSSSNVRYIFGIRNIFGVIPKMKCFECGYIDSAFPILVTNKRKLELAKNNLKKKKAKSKNKMKGKKKNGRR